MRAARIEGDYLLAGQATERDRLALQSVVWEPAGRRLLGELPTLGEATGRRTAVDIGCGCLGWLRLLEEWAAGGQVIGTDVDPRMLALAHSFVRAERLTNVTLVTDDLFDSRLPEAGADLVHARFQVAPLGRADEQLRSYLRLIRPGGLVVLEDPDSTSWRVNPGAPATATLIAYIREAFTAAGGDFDAGRSHPDLLRRHGLEPQTRAEVIALEPGHPYLRLPLQFSASLEPRLLELMSAEEFASLRERVERELVEPGRWGTTFTLVQTWAVVE